MSDVELLISSIKWIKKKNPGFIDVSLQQVMYIWNISREIVFFFLCLNNIFQYHIKSIFLIIIHTLLYEHIWSHQNNRCFLLQLPPPPCVTVLFCHVSTPQLSYCQADYHPTMKCQQHYNSFSLWPGDLPRSLIAHDQRWALPRFDYGSELQ